LLLLSYSFYHHLSDDMGDSEMSDSETSGSETKLPRVILILGTTGVGKSAICYNLGCPAKSSSKPVGTTLDFQSLKSSENKDYVFVDACGFNEGDDGKVTKDEAVKKFFTFCRANMDGFNAVLLIKTPRNDDFFSKNLNLIRSLLPEVPIVIVVQRTTQDYPMQDCDCNGLNDHKYSFHLQQKQLIHGIVGLDLPGQDILESQVFRDELSEQRQKRLDDDKTRLWEVIKEWSKTRYPLTQHGIFTALQEILNAVWSWLTGKILFTTEIMKKVIQALVDAGLKRDEAETMIKDISTGKKK